MKWIKKEKGTSIKDFFLNHMGVSSLDEVNKMFKKSYNGLYVIKDMDKAVNLCLKHIENKGKIRIMGDYDVDGVCSTSILMMGIQATGFKNISFDIPNRSTGFGISVDMVYKAYNENVTLIITCDNGVAQNDAIKVAKDKGIDVIILDHHLPSVEGLPCADAIIDPNAVPGQAEFTGYCGAGICYKFIIEFINAVRSRYSFWKNNEIYRVFRNKMLCLASIATIADVMDLVEENYVFVKKGLEKLNSYCTSGLKCLLREVGLVYDGITAKDIAFKLAPVINAQERMHDGMAALAVKVLTYDGPIAYIQKDVEKMIEINNVRKAVTTEQQAMSEQYIRDNCLYGDVPLIVRLNACPLGIAGIIAGYLCEEYHVPSIVLVPSNSDSNMLTGSARSCGNYDIYRKLSEVSSLLSRYGGHKAAAGLSLPKNKFAEFCNKLNSISGDFEYTEPDIYYNFEIDRNELNSSVEELLRYEPWGQGNPLPVFKVNDYRVIPNLGSYARLSPSKKAIKLAGQGCEAVGFGESLINSLLKNQPHAVDIVGYLSKSHYGGEKTSIEIVDYEVSNPEKVKTSLAQKLSVMASS